MALSPACSSNGSGAREQTSFGVPDPNGGAAPNATPPGNVPGASPSAPGAAPGGAEGPGAMPPLSGQAPAPVAGADTSTRLPRSTPEAEGIDSRALLTFVQALDDAPNELHSLVLVRHGKVVAEGFWAPYSAEDVHVTYSVTKSFNATAVGFAIQEGLLALDDTLVSHFPELAPAQPSDNLGAMQVRHLLTMSTGHAQDTMDRLRARADGQWTRAFFELAVENPPGAPFVYNSGAAYLLSALVEKVTGTSVAEYLRPRLFEPLGMKTPIWGTSPEGVNLGDGGLSVRTEDLAKFGLLYLQGGQWNGERLLSEAWVAEATGAMVSNGNSESDWNAGYGYQFWRNRLGGYRADGSLGQFAFVLPEQDTVLALTSATEDMAGVMNLVWTHLLPALGPAPLPEDTAAQAALGSKLAELALPAPQGGAESPRGAEVSGSRYLTGGNPYGVQSVQLDFAPGQDATLHIQDADGTHTIRVGLSGWVRGRTGFRKRINELFDTPEQGIAARGAWSDESTFVTQLVFNETPYTMNTRFRFEGDRVFVDTTYNVRWGDDSEAQIIGAR